MNPKDVRSFRLKKTMTLGKVTSWVTVAHNHRGRAEVSISLEVWISAQRRFCTTSLTVMKRNRTARARHNVSDPTTTIKTASKVAFIRQCISSSWQKDTFPALFESYMINQRSSIVKYKTWAPFGCYDRPRLGQYSNSVANARHLSKN